MEAIKLAKDLKIEKQTVEHWQCSANGTDPFEITINENTGMINVKFCYGSTGSTWYGQKGKLKKFLSGVDDYYITKNFFRSQQYFYGDETRINLNKTVRKAFKERKIDFEEMRESLNYIKEDVSFNDGYRYFIDTMQNHPFLCEIWDYDKSNKHEVCVYGFEECVWGINPEDKFFMKKIWPHCRSILLSEVKNAAESEKEN